MGEINRERIPRIGIGVLIFDQEKILLGKRISSHGENCWSPPGGHLEFGETLEECAIREVREETGLVIENPEYFALTNDMFKLENKHYISIFMKVHYPHSVIQNLEPHKVLEWRWFDFNDLPENLFLPLKNLKASRFYK